MAVEDCLGVWAVATMNTYKNCRAGPPWEARQQFSLSQKHHSLARGKHFWVFKPGMYLSQEYQLQHVRGHAGGKLIAQFCWRMMFVCFKNELQVRMRYN